MRRTSVVAVLLAGLIALPLARTATAVEIESNGPRIQLAILLDTSNSMDGLIAQAKSQLWSIVNEFATAKYEGRRPELQVALYEYGKSSLPQGEGYLRMIVPLSTDLDKISEELFALKTNGGQEYCGWVIQEAVEGLNWSASNEDLKIIVIAGNEPFTQGKVDPKKSCRAAISKGIIVNTIHCGAHKLGATTGWKDGADLADGKYMSIDQNKKAVHIAAPQDKEIERLGMELNKTYVAYGQKGKAGLRRQAEQEVNARGAFGGSFVQRQVAKSSSYYRNAEWDLVDADKEGKVDLAELKSEDLPEEMRKMSVEEREAFVNDQAKKRADIQKEIQKLNAERNKYVAEKQRELAEKDGDTLDSALVTAVREQASKRNFELDR